MRKTFVAMLLSLVAVSVTAAPLSMDQVNSLKPKEVELGLIESHPSMYFAYAIRLFKSGKQDNAVLWYYVGQIRYQQYLLANPNLPADGDPAELANLTKGFGRAISDWAAESTDAWANTIKRALIWDAANPNLTTSKESFPAALEQARKSVEDMRTYVIKNSAAIEADRQARGVNR